ncbi:Crossover junction endonuclease mus81, partial [Rhizopus stolonifer]
AYNSLCKCPVSFSHPSEASKLDGIGPGMVKKLEACMREHCKENGIPMPELPGQSRKRKAVSDETEDAETSTRPTKPKRTPKPYVPAYRTGGYAIMLALLDFHQVGQSSVTREQICRIAQAHCDTSLTLADPGKSYTAFNSIKTLCDKGYVWRNGKPAKFQLTETGIALAERLRQVSAAEKDGNVDDDETDLSLYSQNPSTTRNSNRSALSNTPETISSRADIMNALAMPSTDSEPKKRKSNKGKSATSAYLDDLLERMDQQASNETNMSLYVLHPSKHTSLTVNGKTVTNTATAFAKPKLKAQSNPSSSITNSFAQGVVQDKDDNDFNDLMSHSAKKPVNHKRHFNVDEFQIDLSPSSSLPSFNSTMADTNDIVDLLSSPEPSPPLPAKDSFDQDYFPLSQPRTKTVLHDTFHYTFLDAENQPVRHVSKATVDVDETQASLSYLVQFYAKQANHPKAAHVHKQRKEGDLITGYMNQDHIDTVCPGLPATPVLCLHQEDNTEDTFWPVSNRPYSPTALSIESSQPSDLSSQAFFPQESQLKTDYHALVNKAFMEPMFPHEYDIVLVVDSREIQMKGNRDYFEKNLTAKGIQCITRSMDLGDVIWIARKKESPSEELFLDYVVERKRLDDLVSSIKDGRFTEQKMRLKRSGAEKIMYIIEEYNREEAERFGAQAIQTAMSATQIIEGIFLKRTNSIDETIDYLVSATKLIQKIYQNTTLYSIPGHIITRQNYLELKAACRQKAKKSNEKSAYLVSYSLYNQLNAKNGSTSLHEIYLKMLMTIRGVNAERALALMKVYPTPKSLLEAFKGMSPEKGKVLAKNVTKGNISRRRWGIQISQRLYDTWGAFTYRKDTDSDDDHEVDEQGEEEEEETMFLE